MAAKTPQYSPPAYLGVARQLKDFFPNEAEKQGRYGLRIIGAILYTHLLYHEQERSPFPDGKMDSLLGLGKRMKYEVGSRVGKDNVRDTSYETVAGRPRIPDGMSESDYLRTVTNSRSPRLAEKPEYAKILNIERHLSPADRQRVKDVIPMVLAALETYKNEVDDKFGAIDAQRSDYLMSVRTGQGADERLAMDLVIAYATGLTVSEARTIMQQSNGTKKGAHLLKKANAGGLVRVPEERRTASLDSQQTTIDLMVQSIVSPIEGDDTLFFDPSEAYGTLQNRLDREIALAEKYIEGRNKVIEDFVEGGKGPHDDDVIEVQREIRGKESEMEELGASLGKIKASPDQVYKARKVDIKEVLRESHLEALRDGREDSFYRYVFHYMDQMPTAFRKPTSKKKHSPLTIFGHTVYAAIREYLIETLPGVKGNEKKYLRPDAIEERIARTTQYFSFMGEQTPDLMVDRYFAITENTGRFQEARVQVDAGIRRTQFVHDAAHQFGSTNSDERKDMIRDFFIKLAPHLDTQLEMTQNAGKFFDLVEHLGKEVTTRPTDNVSVQTQ